MFCIETVVSLGFFIMCSFYMTE